ncbi:MAG: hypothetical protein BWY89_02074 [Bacteroidetes bacterium ADurb.BinA012]|nr:MAG: hypothetical protein BWY89_02074 [Bacteroidetes bacterium ADurb.BinA012]
MFLPGIVIQSPSFTILLVESCTLATRPSSVSLNTTASTAVATPSPAKTLVRDTLKRTEIMIRIPANATSTLTICT